MKNLIISSLTLFCFLTINSTSLAQENPPARVGFQINQIQGDFGLGLNLDIPLLKHWPVIRLAASNHWIEIPEAANTKTSFYQTVSIGVANKGWPISDKIKVYADGGLMLLIPSNELSSKSILPGGFGLFGFEFFTAKQGSSSLFLEMGGTTAGLRLDRRQNIPAFGAGMLISTGFRIDLSKN
jgi:hypothetical protein